MSDTLEGLTKLNRELLTRNGELVKQLNRMRVERDNFEQLFLDWKKINNDASEALNLLQIDKKKLEKENNSLNVQLKEYEMEIASLRMENNEIRRECQQSENVNTLKFNYQQKKNEMDEMLYHIKKLFVFVDNNYPEVTSNFDSNSKRKEKRKKKKDKQQQPVIMINNKISPELLGPNDTVRSDPFARTVSSHSFFTEQRYRYNQVQLNMAGNKLWSKRDSLSKKKKAARINAIPSSTDNTPLTTPKQSLRGRLSDDDIIDDHDIYFDEDPHQKYLQMMGEKDSIDRKTENDSNSNQTRNKLVDKKAIHELFDMLQQQTLSSSITPTTNSDVDAVRDVAVTNDEYDNHAPLVPLPEPSDSSSDSSSD